ncbi:hypothetical protein B4V05_10030 (plasmid) [Latilactobacillus sakei]|nr:hypothetical protein B4V05_10030 [Latilactobacillus sakei]
MLCINSFKPRLSVYTCLGFFINFSTCNMKKIEIKFSVKTDFEKFKQEYFRLPITDVFLIGQSERYLKYTVLVRESISAIQLLNNIQGRHITSFLKSHRNDLFKHNDDKTMMEVYSLILNSLRKIISENNYWSLSRNDKNFVIEGIFKDISDSHEDGLKHGYLSYFSNLKYFESQLGAIIEGNKYREIETKIRYMNDDEQKHLIKNINSCSEQISEFIWDLCHVLEKHFEDINLDYLPNPDTFFSNSDIKMDYSKFHRLVFKNPVLIERYKTESFSIYRIVMSLYFNILPLLGISLIERNHIIAMFCQHVEDSFDINWKMQLEESIEYERGKHVS